jgi:hypothetical protein
MPQKIKRKTNEQMIEKCLRLGKKESSLIRIE